MAGTIIYVFVYTISDLVIEYLKGTIPIYIYVGNIKLRKTRGMPDERVGIYVYTFVRFLSIFNFR